MQIELNTMNAFGAQLTDAERTATGKDAPAAVRPYLSLWGALETTALVSLPALATETGTAHVFLKNEAERLGRGSFKALGGAYAVMVLFKTLWEEQLGTRAEISHLTSAEARAFAKTVTVCCATDGNHGKSVAAGARLLGCTSVIFVHAGVSASRIEAIGADEIIQIQGSYDESVEAAERVAGERGWLLVSDTSWPGYETIPALVAQGYTILAEEALQQVEDLGFGPPTHVFLQAGVGGFASSIAGYLKDALGASDLAAVIVEPDLAACLFASARARCLTSVTPTAPTVMAMLECYTPSLIAWRILEKTADAFMTVSEEQAKDAMRRLAFPQDGTPAIIAGESGAAGLAGFLALANDPVARAKLNLGKDSRVLVINTETATDPRSYEDIVGVAPDMIARGGKT
ncbi:diaminopropionate ammonia-lyase [Pararhizobium polonicum]|nr:diaminopropionate ammonia-lyase [Pararhizobium polonicum]